MLVAQVDGLLMLEWGDKRGWGSAIKWQPVIHVHQSRHVWDQMPTSSLGWAGRSFRWAGRAERYCEWASERDGQIRVTSSRCTTDSSGQLKLLAVCMSHPVAQYKEARAQEPNRLGTGMIQWGWKSLFTRGLMQTYGLDRWCPGLSRRMELVCASFSESLMSVGSRKGFLACVPWLDLTWHQSHCGYMKSQPERASSIEWEPPPQSTNDVPHCWLLSKTFPIPSSTHKQRRPQSKAFAAPWQSSR